MQPLPFNVLINLSYKDIINTCKTSNLFFNVCKNPYFWYEKSRLDFDIDTLAFSEILERDNKARYEYLMRTSIHEGIIDSSSEGLVNLLDYFLRIGDYNEDDIKVAGHQAVKFDRINIIDHMINKYNYDINKLLIYAAQSENINLIDLLKSYGANDFENAIQGAKSFNRLSSSVLNRLK